MRLRFFKFYLAIIFISIYSSAYSQENFKAANSTENIIDSLKKSGIIFNVNPTKTDISLTKSQALMYLQQVLHSQIWNDKHDSLRLAFGRLIYEAEHPPVDSLKDMLMKYPFDSLSIPWDKFYIWEPLRLKIPYIPQPVFNSNDTLGKVKAVVAEKITDSLKIEQHDLTKPFDRLNPAAGLKDTTIMVIIDTLSEVASSYSRTPFKYLKYPFQSDSIKAAVVSLVNYLNERDSTIIDLTGVGKGVTPIMMNSKSGKVIRYWLKNELSDSVTVWIGSPSRNTLGLYLEKGVTFKRPVKQGNYASARVDTKSLDKTKLLEIQNIAQKLQFWKYRTEASFVLNQSSLTNWVRGGENSIATALDITGYADYVDKVLKLSSNNFARIKFGYIASGEDGFRKNLDLLETNSKLNHKAFGKFDFSGILLIKTQIAGGRNYFKTAAGKDTSNLVSKFFNPIIITIGFGLDYKPNKTTSINFSPLSYKGTFVTDPAYIDQKYYSHRIDQTVYGIAKNKKSLNEPGVSFMISNEFRPVEKVTLVNRLQLFTNYIHNPQNVDIDWEMIATAKINWFTDVRFNTHLIFDDDTRTDETYKNGSPVLRADGTTKKSARIQFKEMLGFSLSFRF